MTLSLTEFCHLYRLVHMHMRPVRLLLKMRNKASHEGLAVKLKFRYSHFFFKRVLLPKFTKLFLKPFYKVFYSLPITSRLLFWVCLMDPGSTRHKLLSAHPFRKCLCLHFCFYPTLFNSTAFSNVLLAD